MHATLARRPDRLEPRRPGAKTWSHFTTMVTGVELRGNDITDAWLAARVIGLGAHFVTFDRGFKRFPGLLLTVLG